MKELGSISLGDLDEAIEVLNDEYPDKNVLSLL